MTRPYARLGNRALGAVLIGLAMILAAAPGASAGWAEVERIGPDEYEGPIAGGLAGNARGDAVAAWRSGWGIEVAVSRRGGPFGKARRVPGGENGHFPRVDVNERGKAVIAWETGKASCCRRVHVAGLNVSRGFGRSRPVTGSNRDAFLSAAAIGPRGEAAVVFSIGSEELRARVSPPSGDFGPIRKVSDGRWTRLLALWFRDNHFHALYRAWTGDTTLRERAIAAGAESHAPAPQLPRDARLVVATAPNGRQAAIWHEPNGGETFAATRPPGGAFTARKVMDGTPGDDLRVAIAPSGAAVAAWASGRDQDGEEGIVDPTPGVIFTTYRPAGEAFGDVRAFRPTPELAYLDDIELAIDSAGRSVIAWRSRRETLLAAFQVRGGELRDVRTLNSVHPVGPFGLAIDARGRAHLAWEQHVPGGREAAANEVAAIRGTAPR